MIKSIVNAILLAIARLFFSVEAMEGKLLDLLYEVFEVFAGITPIRYNGTKGYLLDAFFSNNIISTIYQGMAVIGIAMTFGFAIAAVIKKGFDSTGEKVKATYGMIIGNVLKAILLILLMTAIVSATITATSVLMQQIDYLFDNSEAINDPSEITFDEAEYATMFRIIDTIGNYSLNASYNSRFNINSCYNTIRFDMQLLDKQRVFNYTYDATDAAKNSWQAALLEIYNAADIYSDIPLDKYNPSVTKAITNCVEKIQTDASFRPLGYYNRGYSTTSNESVLGRTILVASSFNAANNRKYNENPSLNDSIRAPFYSGRKDIYSLGQVEDVFDVSFDTWNHLVAIFVTLLLILEFLKILVNCTGRIFNIILLYITAPAFISVKPLDDGGKMKQWTTAFVIQSLSIFGTVIAVRLMIVFIPIILSSDLILFTNTYKDIMAKIILIVGICMTAQKASGMISGILADNAGYQSIIAGDVGSGVVARGLSLGSRALGGAMRAGKAVGGAALKMGKGAATFAGLSTAYDKTLGKQGLGGKMSNWGQAMRDKGGIWGTYKQGWNTKTSAQDQQDMQDKEQADLKKSDNEFKMGMINSMNNMSSSVRGLTGALGGGSQGGGTPPKDGSNPPKGGSKDSSTQTMSPQVKAPQGGARPRSNSLPPVPPKQNPATTQKTTSSQVSFSAANKSGYAKKDTK